MWISKSTECNPIHIFCYIPGAQNNGKIQLAVFLDKKIEFACNQQTFLKSYKNMIQQELPQLSFPAT